MSITTVVILILTGFLIGIPVGMIFEDTMDIVKIKDKIRK